MRGNVENILITGASGLVGYHAVQYLGGQGTFRIAAVYQSMKPLFQGLNDIILIRADLSKKEPWQQLESFPADVMIHCAARIPASPVPGDQDEAGRINLKIDEHAVEYAKKKKCRLIYLSSAGVYGHQGDVLRNEDSGLSPEGDYFHAKISSEERISTLKDIAPYFIFRISAPYGPHQTHATVLTTFIGRALRNEPLLYYGSGSRSQDFIYAQDIARACLAARNSDHSGIYNIASGETTSTKTLASLIKELAGSASEVAPAGTSDVQEQYRARYDISKASTLLGWTPVYPLRDGLRECIEHRRRESHRAVR